MNVLNQTIKNGEFDKNHPNYQALSALAKNLIEGLINTDAERRLTVQQALNHPWLSQTNN